MKPIMIIPVIVAATVIYFGVGMLYSEKAGVRLMAVPMVVFGGLGAYVISSILLIEEKNVSGSDETIALILIFISIFVSGIIQARAHKKKRAL